MVIADNGGAPFPPYRSQLFPSNFPWFSNGFTGVPLSRSQFFPNGYGYGYTGCVPIRPQFYTQVWQEEEDSEEVEVDVEEVKGDSENKALHKCCKFLVDWFHRFYDNLSHFKQFFVDWFHQFYENFDFKQFLSNSKHYRERSTVFLEHLAEFMASLNSVNCIGEKESPQHRSRGQRLLVFVVGSKGKLCTSSAAEASSVRPFVVRKGGDRRQGRRQGVVFVSSSEFCTSADGRRLRQWRRRLVFNS
nr:hypothetical protein Iba_scaffold15400CG0220 [Ipomoea batatas]